ncbi:DUF1254 domain-containing protein [Rhizorhabdus dicambivorans]|uniref:DUF1254 domain-containing protein n=1 Tax=Rhizorhabdus dicambivorans TaxID=1850238 RepID=A0A2A4FXG5_9SPHN|nr:DUF1254 domain-containing protein [Rhizorhabdus dicambivorans]ATE63749.1 hypothetical protein CMV14_04520 [Rhizorhabdus dicambivorans]PCE42880.1 hypothetical protein COO09_08655 [Rhizorhabdus dicambivorans]
MDVRHLRAWARLVPMILAASPLTAASVSALPPAPSYALDRADQFDPSPRPDVVPGDPSARTALAHILTADAVIYGLAGVYQYEQMYRQAVDRDAPRFTGFNRFWHDNDLAGPGYAAFKAPNSDTLYSNAWLDLRDGPVLIHVPDIGLRYYTLNFFDAFGNPSNISTRTFGSGARTYLVADANWSGKVPDGATLFRVATPQSWILMRLFAADAAELAVARGVQKQVSIVAPARVSADPLRFPAPDIGSPAGFLAILDHVLRTNGHPDQEDALVHRFAQIGIGRDDLFDFARLDPEIQAGIRSGFAEGMRIVEASHTQLGQPTGTGWAKVEKGRYGFNYLNRATVNAVGLGANVSAENHSFTTFVDGDGASLDGSRGAYVLDLDPPPPVDAFWSVTLYDAQNFELFANPLRRYLINGKTPGLKVGPRGSVRIVMAHDRPAKGANWLPAPDGRFFVVIRAYRPRQELLDGKWLPQPIRPIGLPRAARDVAR